MIEDEKLVEELRGYMKERQRAPAWLANTLIDRLAACVARVAVVERERDALRAQKWDTKHADTINETVQMGMARDAALERAEKAERERDEAMKLAWEDARIAAAQEADALFYPDETKISASIREAINALVNPYDRAILTPDAGA